MIIFTAPFVLAAAQPLTRARIGYQTYTRDAVPADVTVSTEATGFPKDAPLRSDTYEAWKPTALPATWQLELNDQLAVDYVGIGGHNLFSCGASVLVETQVGAGAWETFAAQATPADNGAIFFLDSPIACDRVRLTVTGGDVMPFISVIYIGVALAMQKGVSSPYTPINMSRDTVLQATTSRNGQMLGQDYRSNGVSGSASFKMLGAAWVRSYFDPFSRAARKYPYFFAWNPQEFPFEVGYVQTGADIKAVYSGFVDDMDAAWEMKGVGTE